MLSIFCDFCKIPIWDHSDSCIMSVFKDEGNTLCMLRIMLLSSCKFISKPDSCHVCTSTICHSELEMCQILGCLSKHFCISLESKRSFHLNPKDFQRLSCFHNSWIHNLGLWSWCPFLARRTLKKKSAGGAEAFVVVWSPDRRKETSNTIFYFSGEWLCKKSSQISNRVFSFKLVFVSWLSNEGFKGTPIDMMLTLWYFHCLFGALDLNKI